MFSEQLKVAYHEIGHYFGEFITHDGDVSSLNFAAVTNSHKGYTKMALSAKEQDKYCNDGTFAWIFNKLVYLLGGMVTQSLMTKRPFDLEGAAGDLEQIELLLDKNGYYEVADALVEVAAHFIANHVRKYQKEISKAAVQLCKIGYIGSSDFLGIFLPRKNRLDIAEFTSKNLSKRQLNLLLKRER